MGSWFYGSRSLGNITTAKHWLHEAACTYSPWKRNQIGIEETQLWTNQPQQKPMKAIPFSSCRVTRIGCSICWISGVGSLANLGVTWPVTVGPLTMNAWTYFWRSNLQPKSTYYHKQYLPYPFENVLIFNHHPVTFSVFSLTSGSFSWCSSSCTIVCCNVSFASSTSCGSGWLSQRFAFRSSWSVLVSPVSCSSIVNWICWLPWASPQGFGENSSQKQPRKGLPKRGLEGGKTVKSSKNTGK